MHISEGILSPTFLAATAAAAAVGVAIGVRRLREEDIPKTALFTAAFFVASLVHVPVGPSSAHLILNGLLGIVLGWAAFPAILVGLTLQAILFQFGGLTTLGCNTLNMALPAVAAGGLFRAVGPRVGGRGRVLLAGLLGAGAVAASGVMVALSLMTAGDSFTAAAALLLAAHVPIMAVEAVVTGGTVAFLQRVRPEALQAALPATVAAAAMALLLAGHPQAAWAHKVNVFAWFDGREIVGEAYFSGGRRAQGARVELRDQKGKVVSTTKTGKDGRFHLPAPPPGHYRLRLDAGLGHLAQAPVDVEPVGADSGGRGSPGTSGGSAPPADHGGVSGQGLSSPSHAALPAGGMGRCVTPPQLESALDRRLIPVEEELRRLAEAQERISLHDVVSGLGYIFGLMGLALYLAARRRR